MSGVVFPFDFIRVSIFHAHHFVNPIELDVFLVIKVELLITTFGKVNGSSLFDSFSLPVWQNLVRKVLMNFIDLVHPIARVNWSADPESKVKPIILRTECTLELQIPHLDLLIYSRIFTIDQVYKLECCDSGNYYDYYEGY